ncbi:MAG: hypothetical protein CMO01_13885 [Thalassobius sp.]|nr:hypothetical protein [Thalassovita sp.]
MNIFKETQIPFLLTLLLSLSAYHINQIVEIQSKSQILSYQFIEINKVQKDSIIYKDLECTITNYNRTKSIKKIEILMTYKTKLPNPKKILDARIIPTSPSAILNDSYCVNDNNYITRFKIPILHPQSQYTFVFSTEINSKIDEYPKLYLHTDESIMLKAYNYEIFIIKNILEINIVLFLIWATIFIAYIIKYS